MDYREYLLKERERKKRAALINDVEAINLILWDDQEYLRLLAAMYDAQAVEGSLIIDNAMAAARIRKIAKKNGSPLQWENLATISKFLNIVMRRYGQSREQRRAEARRAEARRSWPPTKANLVQK